MWLTAPYWIVIIAVMLFGLCPTYHRHLQQINTWLGMDRSYDVQFGLLYSSFRRNLSIAARERIPFTLWMLEILLFVTAMLVNGAGEGFAALVLEHRTASDFREEHWREAEFTVIYRAVFVCYMQ